MPPQDPFPMTVHRKAPLSRAEMVAIIKGGESVMYNGHIITSESALPSDAQLSVGDPAKEATAIAALQAQQDLIQKTIDALRSGQMPPSAPAPQTGPLLELNPDPAAAKATAPPGPDSSGSGASISDAQADEILAAQRKALLNPQPAPAQAEKATAPAPPPAAPAPQQAESKPKGK